MESSNLNTSSIRDKRHCWKSSAQSKGRHFCCIVAIRSEWKLVGRFYGMLLLLRNVQDLLRDGKTPYERRFGESFKGPVILFGAMVEYHPISTRDQSRLHQLDKKVLPEIFLGYALITGGIWKGDNLIADIEELENMVGSEIYSRRINAKEVSIPRKGEEFIFPVAHGTAKLSGRDFEFREQTVRSEDFSGELQGEPGRASTDRMTLKPEETFGRSKVTSSIVITMNQEFNSMCWRKKHSLNHWNTLMLQGLLTQIWMCCKKNVLMIIGMSIQTNICQILGEDSLNSPYWKKNLPKDICGPGGDWQKFKRLPDQTMCGLKCGPNWESRSESRITRVGKRETEARQCSETEKDLLHWSRRRRIFRKMRRKLERPVAPAMPCKRMDKQHPSLTNVMAAPKNGDEKEFKTMYGCVVESHESTRQRAESLLSEIHEDRIAGKGFTPMTHFNLVHKFVPMPQAMKVLDAKAVVDKEWKKLKTIPAWQLEKV